MRPSSSPRMSVVKKEDKEAKIRDFIALDLQNRRLSGSVTGGAYRLIALSVDSPVARAIVGLAPELEAAGVALEVVFAHSGQPASGEQASSLERVACLRHAPDVRLLDAHEQLILGPETVWIGDCMRRDPATRDAYECYATGSPETASWAQRSFDRVWSRATPVRAGRLPPLVADTVITDSAVAEALIAMNELPPVAGATRH